MRMTGAGGFTLVELMVAVTIGVILLGAAVPSFQTLMLNSRRAALANELVLALAYAKSEAVKRGVRITVCSRQDDATCAGSTTWDNGWLVFVNNDGDGVVDAGDTPPDLVLQVCPALPGGSTLRAGRAQVTFQATGFSPGSNDTFRLCDSRGTSDDRRTNIVVSPQGRVRTEKAVDHDPSPTSCP